MPTQISPSQNKKLITVDLPTQEYDTLTKVAEENQTTIADLLVKIMQKKLTGK